MTLHNCAPTAIEDEPTPLPAPARKAKGAAAQGSLQLNDDDFDLVYFCFWPQRTPTRSHLISACKHGPI